MLSCEISPVGNGNGREMQLSTFSNSPFLYQMCSSGFANIYLITGTVSYVDLVTYFVLKLCIYCSVKTDCFESSEVLMRAEFCQPVKFLFKMYYTVIGRFSECNMKAVIFRGAQRRG